MPTVKRTTFAIFLLATLSCVGCDPITKDIARAYLTDAPPRSLAFETIQLMLVENPGAFMSLGSELPEAFRSLIFVFGVPAILLILCGAFITQPNLSRFDALALALALIVGPGVR